MSGNPRHAVFERSTVYLYKGVLRKVLFCTHWGEKYPGVTWSSLSFQKHFMSKLMIIIKPISEHQQKNSEKWMQSKIILEIKPRVRA